MIHSCPREYKADWKTLWLELEKGSCWDDLYRRFNGVFYGPRETQTGDTILECGGGHETDAMGNRADFIVASYEMNDHPHPGTAPTTYSLAHY